MLSKLLPRNWNDSLSLILLMMIPLLWWKGNMPSEVNGALIASWTLIIQYYFRRAPQ